MTIGLQSLETTYGGALFYRSDNIPALVGGYRQWLAAGRVAADLSTSFAVLRLPAWAPGRSPRPYRGALRVGYVASVEACAATVAPMLAAIAASPGDQFARRVALRGAVTSDAAPSDLRTVRSRVPQRSHL